jgi:hypothetical protein
MWLPKGSYGTATGKIKSYTEHVQPCKSCRAFDMKIEVFQDYYHFIFIPFVAQPGKTAKIRCNNCGEPLLTRSVLEEYENKTRTPFYLFSGLILIAAIIAVVLLADMSTQKEKAKMVANPKVGDVYTIIKPASRYYYFYKLSKIKGDTVLVWQNNYLYFNTVNGLEIKDDFFNTDEEIILTKKILQQMLDNDEINAVDRNYDDSKGFNRVNVPAQ